MKRPASQWYWGDWLRDTALRSCSMAARGLWMDMLCLMHEGTPYGHLRVGRKVILPENLALMVGAPLEVVRECLKELEDAEVFSRDDEGCIYCRRMVRDEEIRRKRAAGGRLGGNPALIGTKKQAPKVGDKVNHPSNLGATPATASATAYISTPNGVDSAPSEKISTTRKKRKKPLTDMPAGFGISDAVLRWYREKGYDERLLPLHFEKFTEQVQARGYQYADWDAALRKSISDDWGDVRKKAAQSARTSVVRAEQGKAWYQTQQGILARGRRYGMEPDPDKPFVYFADQVKAEAKRRAEFELELDAEEALA